VRRMNIRMYSLQESASKDKAKQLLQNPSLFVALQLKNVEIQPKKQYFPARFCTCLVPR